jgi:hypothetical protein
MIGKTRTFTPVEVDIMTMVVFARLLVLYSKRLEGWITGKPGFGMLIDPIRRCRGNSYA